MSKGRHAKPRPPRSDAPLAILVGLLAVGVAVVAWYADTLEALRISVIGLALLCLLTVLLTRTSGRRSTAALRQAIDQSQAQGRSLRHEVERLTTVHTELVLEISRLREQVTGYIAPVAVASEPIYPSLHLPLVRAAFADEFDPVVPITQPVQQRDETPIDVEGDGGFDPRAPRQLLDLTASEIARLRAAN